MKLIIVESPTKAKTISQFLNSDFIVEASNGHIRDLPKGKMGIDIENNFQPQYVIPRNKRKIVNKLKKLAEKAEKIYLATDEDREGEAISWHLTKVLPKKEIKRMVFHEITEEAIKNALKNPREIDINLVNSQQARRILDRLVGYSLSPLLWKKVAKGLSAGRVQSPALRLICEREKEIEKFKPKEYWTIAVNLKTNGDKFEAKLIKIENKTLNKLESKEKTDKILKDLKNVNYFVSEIEEKKTKRNPLPPFKTSTLQQEANKKLGFSAKKTMLLAQQLYEGIEIEKNRSVGLITYMRTDSLNLSEKFLAEAEKYIKENIGENYLEIKKFKTKEKLAQEAHEAIRPTSCFREPEKIKKYLNKDQYKLYKLIWQRAISSQMKPAIFHTTSVIIKAGKYSFKATGSSIKFDGWLKVYPEKQKENILPQLKVNQRLKLINVKKEQHLTEPPPRYNDSSLVKTLESLGIGRPSTYAPIITTLQERNYIKREKRSFKPTEIGLVVNDLLKKHFPEIVDYKFTAEMEEKLDEIAQGKKNWQEMIRNFYQSFKENLLKKEREIKKIHTEKKTGEKCPLCGRPLVIKMSRYGKFLACSGFPECRFTKPLSEDKENNKR